MTQQEIQKEIIENNTEIEKLFNGEYFILNSKISSLIARNRYLQSICPHDPGKEICPFCGANRVQEENTYY